MRKIPVFVSCPTMLSVEQEKSRKVIIGIIDDLQLEPRALGRSDYPNDYPLKEVFIHKVPPPKPSKEKMDELRQVFLDWFGRVNNKYREY